VWYNNIYTRTNLGREVRMLKAILLSIFLFSTIAPLMAAESIACGLLCTNCRASGGTCACDDTKSPPEYTCTWTGGAQQQRLMRR
jgi:hypothetical protein